MASIPFYLSSSGYIINCTPYVPFDTVYFVMWGRAFLFRTPRFALIFSDAVVFSPPTFPPLAMYVQ